LTGRNQPGIGHAEKLRVPNAGSRRAALAMAAVP
ncbi:MAG: hypothetical protein JWO42_3090, partial [Chloroflexi bacterium]|nr:hypothetical protein [Chloroflexota bacterium]